ncbi:MAG: pitrilysin family protein [bacterium]|nr:pitrilysin family protein [bacterium]
MFHKTVLDNGLTIVSERIPYVRSVSIGVWMLAGSRQEEAEQNGLAHFIEHMNFKGTPTRTAKQIATYIESVGGSMNASTDRELACFYAKVLDQHLPLACDLLSDIVLHSNYTPADVEKEKDVVIEEIRMYEDDPDELLTDIFAATLWKDQALGRPIYGSAQLVQSFKQDDVIRYRQQNYLPENIVISAAGNLEHQQLVDCIHQHFELVQNGNRITKSPEPKPLANYQKVTLDRELEQIHFCLGTESLPRPHPDRYILSVLGVILGGGMSSRLFQEIRENLGLVYTIHSFGVAFRDTGYFAIAGATGPKKLNKVIQLVKTELKNMAQEPVTEEEFNNAKEQLKGGMMLSLESTGSRMTRLADLQIYLGKYISLDETIQKIDAVTREDILRLATQLFADSKQTLTAIGPMKKTG